MLEDVNVLLTGIGAPGAPSIIKCLRMNNERIIRIIGVDMNEKASCRKMVDAFYKVPAGRDSSFIDSILDICRIEGIKIVIPLVTRELEPFARNLSVFHDKGISVSVMQMKALDIVNNKAKLLVKMRELGMRTPEFFVAHTVEEIISDCMKIGYPDKPVCVKYSEGNGSRGVRIVDEKKSRYELFFNEKPNSMYISYSELVSTLREKDNIPEMLVMEYLPGEEYGIDALCEHGKVLYIAGRYNAKVSSSIPQESIIENRKLPIQIAQELITRLELDGNVNFDFIYDKNGNPRLIEINPRLSATIVAYAPAGINFPYLRIKQLLGETMPKCELKKGSMQRRYTEIFFDESGNEIVW